MHCSALHCIAWHGMARHACLLAYCCCCCAVVPLLLLVLRHGTAVVARECVFKGWSWLCHGNAAVLGRGTVVVGVGGHGSSVFVSIHVKGGMVVQGAWLEVVSGWQLAVASLW